MSATSPNAMCAPCSSSGGQLRSIKDDYHLWWKFKGPKGVAGCKWNTRLRIEGRLAREENARWKSLTVDRPIPVAPPVRTTTLSFKVDRREEFSWR